MKKIIAVLCAAVGLLAAVLSAGCGGQDGPNKKIAVAFANSSSSWQKNGNTMKELLEKEGFAVDLQFADTAEQQVEQIRDQLKQQPGCLVIGAVDGEKLADVLTYAKEHGVPVVAYDRLIMGTDAVSYYASYDNEGVGEAMGEYIEARLDLKNGAGPFTMEVFAGDTADNNAHLFFSAAMEVLKPYIANGQLVVPSGETSFEQATVQGWNPDNAQKRMEKLLNGPDAGVHLDVILSPNDGVAGGIRKALTAGGYSQMPLITGQDAEEQAITAIRAGQQAMTTYKDPAVLVAKSIRMIKAVVEGTQPDINNVTTYNNGVITVPAYLCTPLVVDAGNIDVVK
ncbi:substrate-binding domain-containing protein [Anaerovibrio sp.]|uniref:substrate-binding domain-containing protein n=1 Tax=Anaerovibrio sp. TaxID=1872532 RepID=UPI003F1358EB